MILFALFGCPRETPPPPVPEEPAPDEAGGLRFDVYCGDQRCEQWDMRGSKPVGCVVPTPLHHGSRRMEFVDGPLQCDNNAAEQLVTRPWTVDAPAGLEGELRLVGMGAIWTYEMADGGVAYCRALRPDHGLTNGRVRIEALRAACAMPAGLVWSGFGSTDRVYEFGTGTTELKCDGKKCAKVVNTGGEEAVCYVSAVGKGSDWVPLKSGLHPHHGHVSETTASYETTPTYNLKELREECKGHMGEDGTETVLVETDDGVIPSDPKAKGPLGWVKEGSQTKLYYWSDHRDIGSSGPESDERTLAFCFDKSTMELPAKGSISQSNVESSYTDFRDGTCKDHGVVHVMTLSYSSHKK
ncbi:MAG: hypothetical protein H6737_23255 [Alphaproteobacteria bacterium]|nr:hypothetical protein [Alphaproteobacteria bacterium]